MNCKKQPTQPDRSMLNRGAAGELHAERYLRSKGLTVWARNWRCRVGELDLICWDGPELVFVEVKTRVSGRFARQNLFANITGHKKNKLRQLVSLFIARHYCRSKRTVRRIPPYRLDLVGVIVRAGDYALVEIVHSRGAI